MSFGILYKNNYANLAYVIKINMPFWHSLVYKICHKLYAINMKENTLKELRKNFNITQEEASKIVNVPLRTYVRYEIDDKYASTIKYDYIVNMLKKCCEITEDKGILSIESIKNSIKMVLAKYEVSFCYLFGSYAKGYAKETSDVDLLIQTNISGMQFFGLVEELRESLHKNVDLLRVSDVVDNIDLLNEILISGVKIFEQQRY